MVSSKARRTEGKEFDGREGGGFLVSASNDTARLLPESRNFKRRREDTRQDLLWERRSSMRTKCEGESLCFPSSGLLHDCSSPVSMLYAPILSLLSLIPVRKSSFYSIPFLSYWQEGRKTIEVSEWRRESGLSFESKESRLWTRKGLQEKNKTVQFYSVEEDEDAGSRVIFRTLFPSVSAESSDLIWDGGGEDTKREKNL